MANEFPLQFMNFKDINSQDLNFGTVHNNTLLAVNKTTGALEKVSPVDLVGKLLVEGDRISIDFDVNKYVISVQYNLDNLIQIDNELKRITECGCGGNCTSSCTGSSSSSCVGCSAGCIGMCAGSCSGSTSANIV